jgi:hypothetical protein
MANRKIDKILIKKSGVVGKIPTTLELGELAINFADVKLYASGTTSNSIIPIGWDRISRTGDTVTGDFNFNGSISATTYLNLPLDIYTTGTTRINDTLYFNRNNGLSAYTSDVSLSSENNRLLINDSSTGVISFNGLTFSPSGTTFNVGMLKGWFIDNSNPVNPTKLYREFIATSGNTLTNLSGQNVTYISINSSGVLSQSGVPFIPPLQRDNIPLGVIIHSNRTFINAINNQPVVAINPNSQLSDLIESIGIFNIYGNVFSPNGINLSINKSQGEIFKQGCNFVNDNKDPHTLILSALTAPNNIRYRYQNGSEDPDTNIVMPNFWDNNGIKTAMTGTRWQIQRIYLFQSNLIRIMPGQATYASQAEAIQSIPTEAFVVEQNILENGLFRGLLIIRRNTTDLTDTTRALFIEASKFGSVAGLGSLSTTSLQQAYNNSNTPEISIDSTLGAFSIKNGAGTSNSTTNIFEGIDSGNTITSFIRADGGFSGLSISATTYYGLPTDIRITGGTYSAGTAIFQNNTGGTFSVSGFSTGSGGTSYWSAGTGLNAIVTINSTNIASGDYSLAEGYGTQATALSSHAEGDGTQAISFASHAEGTNTIAFGYASHAEGNHTQANGSTSHAEGNHTQANGDYTHAGGQYTQANGESSFVHGDNSFANGYNTIVLGRNITGSTADTTYVDGLNIKTLTGGTSINNLGIDVNGRVVIGSAGGSGATNTYVTGGTYSNGVSILKRNDNVDIYVTGFTSTFTGNTSIDFSFSGGLESDFTTTTINNTNIKTTSSVIYKVISSTDHNEIEDSLLDGLILTESNIIDGVSFTLNAYALNNTWGVYNIFYKIIN